MWLGISLYFIILQNILESINDYNTTVLNVNERLKIKFSFVKIQNKRKCFECLCDSWTYKKDFIYSFICVVQKLFIWMSWNFVSDYFKLIEIDFVKIFLGYNSKKINKLYFKHFFPNS